MRIVFFGTPDFAKEALCAIAEAGHEIAAVVTQPDRQRGRGREMSFSPVKEAALERGWRILQPVRVREEETVRALKEAGAELFVVAAFGQILPGEVLDIPPLGCINIHASLLPLLRGAAPIQQAILEGYTETGITIMQMDEGCDTGDILSQVRVPIGASDTGGSLFDKLSRAGAEEIVRMLPLIGQGKVTHIPQDETRATMSQKLTKACGRIDWSRDAAYLDRLVRACTPWPGAYTTWNGKTLKILSGTPEKETDDKKALPGTVTGADASGIRIACGEGTFLVTQLQMEGKKRMSAADFLNGCRLEAGTTLS